jgi:hypothetical protein
MGARLTRAVVIGVVGLAALTVGSAPAPAAKHGPIPASLRTAESASEDTIDLALAGRRAKVVEKANSLKKVAHGSAAAALHAAGVSDRRIAEFRARADTVARLAPHAALLRVALAANRAFGLIPGFFALYDSPVPAQVTALDHLDFEAKLQAKAGDAAALRAAVAGLERTWARLRPGVVAAGGVSVARKFDAHVARLRRLAAHAGPATAREAQRGLDLVDEIEAVYQR